MSVRTDVINLQVNINGNAAQNSLNELRKKAKDIAFEMDGLKKGTQEYINKKKELSTVTAEMDKLKKEIGLTALSQKELVAELNKLKALRGSTIPFSQEYKEFAKQIKEVENRLYDVKNGVQGFSSFFSKIKDEVKQFGALAIGYLGFQFLGEQFTNIVKGAGKLSDQLADLRRVSGLTEEEATKLNSSLSKLDTRTAVGSLRDIAVIAGKLGVAKQDILSFTEATDKLVVSLGDELGDADQITTQLGKILNVFDGKVDGDNITRLGNSFVTLANAGVASGGFIAEFDQRLASVAKSAGIGLGELSGLGAGLEELGGKVESSSTAFQKLLGTISADIPAAAKIAGVSTEAFRKLFNEDAIGASLKYSAALVKNKNSLEEVTKSLQGAGEDGARTINLINTLGQKSEFLAGKVKIGADALKESSQITEAFALKNDNFGASLDKLGKDFNSFVSSPGLTNFLKGAVDNARSFIAVLKEIPKFIADNSLAFQLLIAGIALLNIQYIKSAVVIGIDTLARIQNAIVTRATAIANNIASVATAAYIVVTNLATGSITAATAAQRLWSVALSLGAGPLGVIVVAVGVLVVGISSLIGKTKELTIEQQAQATLSKRAADAYSDQVNKLELLKGILTSNNFSLEENKRAYEQLIKINPEFAKTLQLDAKGHLIATEALDKYIASLKRKGELEAAQQLSNEIFKEVLKTQKQVDDLTPKSKKTGLLKTIFQLGTDDELRQEAKDAANKKLSELKKQKEFYDKFVAAGITGDVTTPGATIDDSITTTTGTSAADAKAAAAEKKRRDDESARKLEQLRKDAEAFAAELKKLRARAEAGTLSEDNKERALIEEKYRELTARAAQYWKDNVDLADKATADILAIRNAQLTALNNKIFERDAAKEYEESLRISDQFYDAKKVKAQQDFVAGKITKTQYDQEIINIEIDTARNRVQIASDYTLYVDKAEKDLTKFKRNELDKQTADAIAAEQRRRKASVDDKLAEAKLRVLITPKGSDARLEAEKNYLKTKYELTEKNADDTVKMRELKERELADAITELERQQLQQKIDNALVYINAFQNALQSLTTIFTNRENRELQRDKLANDKKKNNYKNQLDSKLISQAQYEKNVQKITEEQERKDKEIKLRQAKREKALAIFNAIINTAAGIAKAIPNLPLMALAGITGALQIKAASSAPLPEFGRGGHLTSGPKHSDSSRGLHVVNPLTGRTEMLLERNEAVIASAAMESNRRMTVSGTPKQIASAINSSHGGVSFANGATVSAGWYTQRAPTIRPGIVRMMAQGGIIGSAAAEETSNFNAANLDALNAIAAAQEGLREDMKNFNTNLKAFVVLKEVKKADADYNAAKRASGF